MMILKYLSVLKILTLLFFVNNSFAQQKSLRNEAEWIDQTLQKRFDTLIPELMRREKVDLWVISAREYNEDPVMRTMLPATWLWARRRTILVFFDNGKTVERFAIARYSIGTFFEKAWNPEVEPNQYKALATLIESKNPKTIALNYSNTFAQTDGITHSEFELLKNELSPSSKEKIQSAEKLAVAWLETRIPEEIEMMKFLCNEGHRLIKKGFSTQAIQLGKTTTEDLEWWFREEIRNMGYQTWFHTSVDIQRNEEPEHSGDYSGKPDKMIIQKGDLLHVDIGITYGRLNTDQQQHAYVLKEGEKSAPKGLSAALVVGNRLQDHLTNSFKTGLSGNQILKNAREQAIKDGIRPSIYTHPLGFYGHASGPTIGMWDNQVSVSGTGDYPLYANTGYSIELNATVFVKEWNKDVRIMLEENAWFDGAQVNYFDKRQTELILIK